MKKINQLLIKSLSVGTLSVSVLFLSACKKNKHETDLTTCTPLSYTNDIRPLLDLHCNNASCHGANQQPVLTYYSAVKSSVDNGSFEKEVILNRTMPEGTSLSNEDYDLFNCWLNAGAPE